MAEIKNKEITEKNPFRIRSLFYWLAGVLFALAIFSHQAEDFSVLAGGNDGVVGNWIGNIGAHVACTLFIVLGLAAYVLALIILLAAFRTFLPQKLSRTWLFLPGILLTVAGASLLFAYDPAAFAASCESVGIGRVGAPDLSLAGGTIGQVLVAPASGDLQPGPLRLYLGPVGSILFSGTLLLAGLIMLYRSDWHSVLVSVVDSLGVASEHAGSLGEKSSRVKESFADRARKLMQRCEKLESVADKADKKNKFPSESAVEEAVGTVAQNNIVMPEQAQTPDLIPVETIEEPIAEETPAIRASVPAGNSGNTLATPSPTVLAKPSLVEAGEQPLKVRNNAYTLPIATMLGKGSEVAGEKPELIAQNKEVLQAVLESFKIDGQVTGHVSGPRVTRYEIKLAPSVKVNKVTEIENNIAMNLKARSLRILAPIPGRDVIGVEVPNSKAEGITMRSIMETDAWVDGHMEIPLVLGKDVSGNPVVLDLAQAPHLLIAGATGSGKSVCMNTLIMSLLMKFSPDDLKLILVDPKVVEMADYATLPHLITPVIDDFKKVPLALRWATVEMDKRYKQLARAGVRKLADYNSRQLPETPVLDEDGLPIPDKLPVLIVIIDELADLMQTDARSDIESSISRIAAKGRAAGVHIVVATQRPSRDVITGTIKSNLPTRISFRVPSLTDSRVILDQKGAEALLGMGDMLLLAPKRGLELERIQGAWVADGDIKQVVKFVSDQAPQSFNQQVVASEEDEDDVPEDGSKRNVRSGMGACGDWSEEETDAFIDSGFELDPMVARYMQPGDDDLMRRALEVVLLEKKASTSYIQRRLKIGYNRAAEIIDLLEERQIVGPASGSGAKRDILVFDDIINQ